MALRPLILDWGVGGMSVVRFLPPKVGFVYLSDSGHLPYGKTPALELRERLASILTHAKSEWGCDLAVIACNAASTVVLDQDMPLPVLDVISCALKLVRRTAPKRLGVIGGDRTIASGVYQKAFKNMEVRAVSAQALSAWVERGITDSPDIRSTVVGLGRKLGDISHLLLACTHYPALTSIFAAKLPGIGLLDPAQDMASAILDSCDSQGARDFYSTGDGALLQQSASKTFGVSTGKVSRPLHFERA